MLFALVPHGIEDLPTMKRWIRNIFLVGFLIAIAITTVFLLANVSQNNKSLILVITSIIIGAILIVVGIGYWVLTQIFPILGEPKSQLEKRRGFRFRKQPIKSNHPPSTSKDSEWLKEQYPNALIIDSKTLIKEYKKGKRNFQNVFPAAEAPYETYLKWVKLDGADFSRAMLYRAPFDGSSLIGVNFSGAYLEGASFRGAILQNANLSWADLNGTDLSGSDLSEADLSFASLQGADLSNATLKGTIVTPEQLEQARSLEGATLPDGTKYE